MLCRQSQGGAAGSRGELAKAGSPWGASGAARPGARRVGGLPESAVSLRVRQSPFLPLPDVVRPHPVPGGPLLHEKVPRPPGRMWRGQCLQAVRGTLLPLVAQRSASAAAPLAM